MTAQEAVLSIVRPAPCPIAAFGQFRYAAARLREGRGAHQIIGDDRKIHPPSSNTAGMPGRVRSARTSLANCAKSASTLSISLPAPHDFHDRKDAVDELFGDSTNSSSTRTRQGSLHTPPGSSPGQLVVSIEFADEATAVRLERYLNLTLTRPSQNRTPSSARHLRRRDARREDGTTTSCCIAPSSLSRRVAVAQRSVRRLLETH